MNAHQDFGTNPAEFCVDLCNGEIGEYVGAGERANVAIVGDEQEQSSENENEGEQKTFMLLCTDDVDRVVDVVAARSAACGSGRVGRDGTVRVSGNAFLDGADRAASSSAASEVSCRNQNRAERNRASLNAVASPLGGFVVRADARVASAVSGGAARRVFRRAQDRAGCRGGAPGRCSVVPKGRARGRRRRQRRRRRALLRAPVSVLSDALRVAVHVPGRARGDLQGKAKRRRSRLRVLRRARLADVPLDLSPPTLFVAVAYGLVGLKPSAGAFFEHLFLTYLAVLVASSLGLFIGATFPATKRAQTVASVVMLSVMLTGGFYFDETPAWLDWTKRTSFVNHAYAALLKTQFPDGGAFKCHEHELEALRATEDATEDAFASFDARRSGKRVVAACRWRTRASSSSWTCASPCGSTSARFSACSSRCDSRRTSR